MLADELRSTFLLAGLTDEQIDAFVAVGTVREATPGEVLFHEGEPADELWVLLDGTIELLRQSGDEMVVLAMLDTPGRWAGGLRAWGDASSSAGYRATARVLTPARLFLVPSEELGRLVGEWFPFGKHIIMGIFQTVRGIEAMARQRESLVALGTLAAGMAHEINNPAAAAVRAVAELRTAGSGMLESLTELARHAVTPEQYIALEDLRDEAVVAAPAARSALARADAEDALIDWMDDHGVDDGWRLAPTLAAARLDPAWCDRMEALLGEGTVSAGLAWVASTLAALALVGEVEEATTRISQLVGSVKAYSQLDRASLQRGDVHDGLRSTLVMLGHRLRAGVDVVTDFDETLPEIDSYAGELNQVWTNLIDNAIDAMDGQGTLRITTRRDGDHVVVDVADSGRGMSQEVMARAFEPFFTTKDVGRGTGLGLDISRRIVVNRHGGDITFDSQPGQTVVHVSLPLPR